MILRLSILISLEEPRKGSTRDCPKYVEISATEKATVDREHGLGRNKDVRPHSVTIMNKHVLVADWLTTLIVNIRRTSGRRRVIGTDHPPPKATDSRALTYSCLRLTLHALRTPSARHYHYHHHRHGTIVDETWLIHNPPLPRLKALALAYSRCSTSSGSSTLQLKRRWPSSVSSSRTVCTSRTRSTTPLPSLSSFTPHWLSRSQSFASCSMACQTTFPESEPLPFCCCCITVLPRRSSSTPSRSSILLLPTHCQSTV